MMDHMVKDKNGFRYHQALDAFMGEVSQVLNSAELALRLHEEIDEQSDAKLEALKQCARTFYNADIVLVRKSGDQVFTAHIKHFSEGRSRVPTWVLTINKNGSFGKKQLEDCMVRWCRSFVNWTKE